MDNFYKGLAFLYDKLMTDINYEKWASFIMSKFPNKCSNVLEAACGTGNITSIMADCNYNITAFDISENMLVEAYNKLRKYRNVKILKADMTKFKVDNKFQACVCCCDGVNYLNGKDLIDFFVRVKEHLTEEGVFIFDISTEYKYKSMDKTYVYEDDSVFYVWENTNISDIELDKLDYNENKIKHDNLEQLEMEINFFVKKNGKYDRITEIQTHYIHKIKRVYEILKEIGFKTINLFDGYTDNEYVEGENYGNKQSQRCVFVCNCQ